MELTEKERQYLYELCDRNNRLKRESENRIKKENGYLETLRECLNNNKKHNIHKDVETEFIQEYERIQKFIDTEKESLFFTCKQGLNKPMSPAERKMRQRIRKKIEAELKDFELVKNAGLRNILFYIGSDYSIVLR